MLIIKSVARTERCGATEPVEFFTLPIILLSEEIQSFFPGSATICLVHVRQGQVKRGRPFRVGHYDF
jgi:hypothetical protein